MKRAYRLRNSAQFQRVRREGKTVSNQWLSLNVAAGRRKNLRCGFIVGKQIGGAVQRNRARRRLREAVRLALDSIRRGYDLVFIVRSPEVATLPFTTLQAAVESLLHRAQLWQEQGHCTTQGL